LTINNSTAPLAVVITAQSDRDIVRTSDLQSKELIADDFCNIDYGLRLSGRNCEYAAIAQKIVARFLLRKFLRGSRHFDDAIESSAQALNLVSSFVVFAQPFNDSVLFLAHVFPFKRGSGSHRITSGQARHES
jgi:hypothetical protein